MVFLILKGRSAALDYFEALNDNEQIKSLGLFELMGNIGEIKNQIMKAEKIYAFKPQPHRFYVFLFRK